SDIADRTVGLETVDRTAHFSNGRIKVPRRPTIPTHDDGMCLPRLNTKQSSSQGHKNNQPQRSEVAEHDGISKDSASSTGRGSGRTHRISAALPPPTTIHRYCGFDAHHRRIEGIRQ